MSKPRSRSPAHYLVLWAIMEDEHLSAPAKCVATALLLKFRDHETTQCNPGFTTLGKVRRTKAQIGDRRVERIEGRRLD
jgi:hypothetical protein